MTIVGTICVTVSVIFDSGPISVVPASLLAAPVAVAVTVTVTVAVAVAVAVATTVVFSVTTLMHVVPSDRAV